MVVEERIYVLHTGADLQEYLTVYESEGLPVQKPVLGGFLGYFTTEFGTQNQLVHLWAYADLEDRRRRRAELATNEQWKGCLRKIRPMIMTMENRIMYPTRFSPIGSMHPVPGSAPAAAAEVGSVSGGS
jgi:hypothetical protein